MSKEQRLPSGPAWGIEAEQAAKQARAELRDRFAMAVVSGVYLHWRTSLDREQLWVDFQDIAEMAYEVADAMLKARGDE